MTRGTDSRRPWLSRDRTTQRERGGGGTVGGRASFRSLRGSIALALLLRNESRDKLRESDRRGGGAATDTANARKKTESRGGAAGEFQPEECPFRIVTQRKGETEAEAESNASRSDRSSMKGSVDFGSNPRWPLSAMLSTSNLTYRKATFYFTKNK